MSPKTEAQLRQELADVWRLLQCERDGNAKDAARYRWLRDKSEPPHNFYISVPVEFHGVRYQPHEVDAYIDAAIEASKGCEG